MTGPEEAALPATAALEKVEGGRLCFFLMIPTLLASNLAFFIPKAPTTLAWFMISLYKPSCLYF